jgi:hypothetical protein
VVVALAAMLATPALAANQATVGDFIIELAKAKRLNAADSRIAVDSLSAVGVRLPADVALNERLTEGEVARISRFAGLAVATSRPDAPFSRLQVERFFASFSGELSQTGATTRACDPAVENCDNPGNPDPDPQAPFDPFAKGKGKKKGKAKVARTPTEPE